MYGGLFGDLPAAKNEPSSSEPRQDDGKNDTTSSTAAAASAKSHGHDDRAQTQTATGVPKRQEPKAVKSSSVLQSLGAAGTSMAFVPSHLKRKRPAVAAAAPKKTISGFVKSTTTTTTSTTNTSTTTAAPKTDLALWKEEVHFVADLPTQDATTTTDSNNINKSDYSSTTAVEPDALRTLHENVTDHYDPLVPNDLLQYWERQAAIQERRELEQEAQRALQNQEAMRQQILQATATGQQSQQQQEESQIKTANTEKEEEENQKLIQQRLMAGRGRGRGVSNLPKWLVDKQQKEAELGKTGQ